MSVILKILSPLLWVILTQCINIDYVEIRDQSNSTGLTSGAPLKLVKFLSDEEIVVQDHSCQSHILLRQDITDYYSINGSLANKIKCQLKPKDIKRIITAKKTRFGIIRPMFVRISQPLFDKVGNLALQSDIEYRIVATDPNKSIEIVFDNNCNKMSLKEDVVASTVSKLLSSSDLMDCENTRSYLSHFISNQTNGTNFGDIIPFEMHPEEIDVNVTDTPLALTIKELMMNNVMKSNLILPNVDGSVKVKSFCPNSTLNSTKIIATTVSVTETETVNQTITEISETLRISPTTLTEKVTDTRTKISMVTEKISVTSTKTLKPSTTTIKITEWSTLKPETTFINLTEIFETTTELNVTQTITSSITLPVITETFNYTEFNTIFVTPEIPIITKVTKTRLLDILITKTRKICPTRRMTSASVQSTLSRISRDLSSQINNDSLFNDAVNLNQSIVNQYLPSFEDHLASLNLSTDLAYKWLDIGYGYKYHKAYEYLEDRNLTINKTTENIEDFKNRYDQLLEHDRFNLPGSINDEERVKEMTLSTIKPRRRRQNFSDERQFWYNLTEPYIDVEFEDNPFLYPQWLINLYEVPQEYLDYWEEEGGLLPLIFNYDIFAIIPDDLALQFFIQRIGVRATLGWMLLEDYSLRNSFKYRDEINNGLRRESRETFNKNYFKVKKWLKTKIITFKPDETVYFPEGTPLPYILTRNATNNRKTENVLQEREKKQILSSRNETLVSLENLLAIENKLDNKSFLASIGAYGIQLTRLGHTYAFNEDFLFIFKIRLPIENLNIADDYNKGSCAGFLTHLPKLNHQDRPKAEKLHQTLVHTCEAFEHTMDSLTQQINSTAQRALQEFKIRTLSRSKRFIDPVSLTVLGVAAAVGFGIYTVTEIQNGKSERKELFRKAATLEEKMDKIAEGVEILSESFLGFQKKTLESFEEFNTKVELLRNYTIEQGNFLKHSILNATRFLDDKNMYTTIMSNVNIYRLAYTNIMQNKMILLLDQIRQLESIFIVLNEGVLSHELLPWAKLEKLLSKIESQFSKDFVFGILPSERHLYYQLPLTSYSIDPITNDLYVSLKIPLIRRNRARTYEIVKIQANPFVCQTEKCFDFGESNKAISFDLNGRLLLVNPLTGQLMNEVDYDGLVCRFQSHRQLCHSFNPNTFYEVSPCVKAIFDFNATEISKNCPLKQRQISEYTPIAIANNAFVIHTKMVPFFDILCRGDNPIRVRTEKWVEIIEPKRNCDYYLTNLGKIIYGPLGKVLKSKQNITLYQSELIDMIERASNQTKFEFSQFGLGNDTLIDFHEFDSAKHNITLSWDTTTVNRYADYINKVSRNITNVIHDMRTIRNKKFSSYSLKGFVGTMSGVIQLMSTFILVFGVLTYSKLLGYTSSLTIIAPRRVEALVLDIGFDILPNDYATLLDMITALLLLVMIVIIVKITFFRKHFISSHFIKGEGLLSSDTKFKISINIVHTSICLCSIHTENIYISLPLNRFNRLKRLREIRVKNMLYTWLLKEEGNRLFLKLAEDIQLIAVDENDATHTSHHRIFLPLEKMGYLYSAKPVALSKSRNYGNAYVSVSRRIDFQYGETSKVTDETQI